MPETSARWKSPGNCPLSAPSGLYMEILTGRTYADLSSNQPLHRRWCRVLIKHIGGYPGNYDPSIRGSLLVKPPQLFISGHSHILKVKYDKTLDMLHINPGAAGISGFHKVRTLVRFCIDNGEFKDLEVIELADKL